MGLIPTPYKYLAYGLLLLALLTTAYIKGMAHVQDQWNDSIQKENIATLTRTVVRHEITEKVVTQFVDKVKIVKEKGDTIIKEVPYVVTKEVDSACPINNGFVRLWNDSNKGELSASTRDIDASTSRVVLSDVATQHAREAEICRATEEQLKSLQQWIREQSELK